MAKGRFALSLFVLALCGTLQIAIATAYPLAAPNLVFAALITFSFFSEGLAFIALVLFGAFLVQWGSGANPELIFFILIPCAVFLLKRFAGWQMWIMNLLCVFGGLLLYRVAVLGGAALGSGFAYDSAVGVACGAALYAWYAGLYKPMQKPFAFR